MLFNSYEFIFLYLPVVFLGFFSFACYSRRAAAIWLATASLFFYGWWNPRFVTLLLTSIIFNYGAGYLICHAKVGNRSKNILIISIAANLALLGLFKYANFFIETAKTIGAHWSTLDIILPLGISFFTFTQIAFLVDSYRGIAHECSFTKYLLFITWFPHLIAGPVLHHKQMMPQFDLAATYRPNPQSIAVGLTYLSLGLFKKVVLADQFALFANPVFDGAEHNMQPLFVEAWAGALAYTFQLYFDFSGYSDMAIGVSRIFNIKLPLNFNSPYKATSIIDFWHRWHMTLSTFLRNYLYVPLGGNRTGRFRRHLNIFITMLLGGLWHGAGWNFALWGALHGIYLIVNHAWRSLTGSLGTPGNWFVNKLSLLITFVVVVIAWVPFRASDMQVTKILWLSMAGLNGLSLTIPVELTQQFLKHLNSFFTFASYIALNPEKLIEVLSLLSFWFSLGWYILLDQYVLYPLGFIILWFMPNSQEFVEKLFQPSINPGSAPQPTYSTTFLFGLLAGCLFALAVLNFGKFSPYLYFQF